MNTNFTIFQEQGASSRPPKAGLGTTGCVVDLHLWVLFDHLGHDGAFWYIDCVLGHPGSGLKYHIDSDFSYVLVFRELFCLPAVFVLLHPAFMLLGRLLLVVVKLLHNVFVVLLSILLCFSVNVPSTYSWPGTVCHANMVPVSGHRITYLGTRLSFCQSWTPGPDIDVEHTLTAYCTSGLSTAQQLCLATAHLYKLVLSASNSSRIEAFSTWLSGASSDSHGLASILSPFMFSLSNSLWQLA